MNSKTNRLSADYVKANEEKAYRQNRLDNGCSSLFELNRSEVLAKNIDEINNDNEWCSYFDVYKTLYSLL